MTLSFVTPIAIRHTLTGLWAVPKLTSILGGQTGKQKTCHHMDFFFFLRPASSCGNPHGALGVATVAVGAPRVDLEMHLAVNKSTCFCWAMVKVQHSTHFHLPTGLLFLQLDRDLLNVKLCYNDLSPTAQMPLLSPGEKRCGRQSEAGARSFSQAPGSLGRPPGTQEWSMVTGGQQQIHLVLRCSWNLSP